MKTKSKVFAKLLAIVLAVLMACSTALPVFAAGFNANRADKAATVSKNWVDWVEMLSDDACEAMLDAADEWLKDLDLTYLASCGQLNANYTLPMEMDLTSMSSLVTAGHAYVYLGNQSNSSGKYYTGTSGDVPTSGTTAPGMNRVYIHVYARALLPSATMHLAGYADSVDGVIDILRQVKTGLLDNASIAGFNLVGMILGDYVKAIDWSALTNLSYNTSGSNSQCGKNFRSKNGAKALMKAIAEFLDDNFYMNSSNGLLYALLAGTLSLGALNDTVGLYYKPGDNKTGQQARDDGIIGGLLTGDKAPIWDGFETNGYLVYNGLAAYVMNHELPTTDGSAYYGIDENGNKLYTTPSSGALTSGTYKYYGSNTASAWNYDKVILDCVSRYVLQNININITYPEYVQNEDGKWVHDSSQARYKRGDTDPNLEYNKDGNVYLFRYNGEKLWLTDSDNLYDFAYRALKIAWKTALKPTLHLVQINYGGHEGDGKGSNFDNAYLDWYIENIATGTVRSFDPETAYTAANVEAWAADVCSSYGVADGATFLEENVKNSFNYDEERKATNEYYNWRDVEVTQLWNMVRYSPLADKYFDIRTGAANLYFLQLGTSNIDTFMDAVCAGTKTYGGIIEALNDFLVAALKDIFPDSANIGYNNRENGEYEDTALPTGYAETTTFNAETVMNNIYKTLEYVANTTDADLLNPYYVVHSIADYDGTTQNINASNIEEAIIPFAIALLKQWNLTAPIHNSDWDKVSDIESGAVVALQEYLGYVFPDRDYSSLWTEVETAVGDTGKSYKLIKAKSGETLYENVIYWMARDAAAYVVVATGTPVPQKNSTKSPWDPYNQSALNSKNEGVNDIFTLANMIGCYFLEDNVSYDTNGTNVKSKGLAALFGLKSSVKSTNTIWTNLNAIFNKILPVAGQLQYNYSSSSYKGNGNFDSSMFINDIIINDVLTLNLGNVVDGLEKIFKAAPIKTTKVNAMLYSDILAPVLNSILGANGLCSGSVDIIPAASSATPFDDFLKPATLVKKYSDYRGVLGGLIHNLYLLFTDNTGSPYFYNAATFLFMTLGMPGQLQEHEIGGVDIKVYNTDLYGTAAKTTVKIKNNSYGINRFFHDNGDLDASKQKEASRYWVKVNNVAIKTAAGATSKTLDSTAYTLAPEKNKYYNSSTASWTATRDTLYKVEVNYDILFDDTLTNGTATTAAAPSTTLKSGLTATKWIYVTPSSYTETHKNIGESTFSGNDFNTKDGNFIGSVVTGTAANQIQITAGQVYDVTASNVAAEGYGVRIVNSGTAKKTGKFYVYPAQGTAYVNRANGASTTVATAAAGQVMAFLAIDEEGNIYKKDGTVYGNYADLTDQNWISGYHKTTNLEGDEVYDYILANAWNAPPEVAFGAPGAGTVIADVTELNYKVDNDHDYSWNNFSLFKSGATDAAVYTVGGVAFATAQNARAIAANIKIAYCGDMDGLRAAIENYADVPACATAIQNGAKAACIQYRNATNLEAWGNADKLKKAILDAGEATAEARAAQITAKRFGATGLDNFDEVDYKIVGHREFRKYLEKYEGMLIKEQVFYLAADLDASKYDAVDEEGYALKGGSKIPVLDAKGRETFTYKAEMPQWKVDEFVRTIGLYQGYAEERAHDLTRINAEIAHATTPCDDFDDITGTPNTVSMFTATPATAARKYVVLDSKGVPALDANGMKQYATGDVSEYRFAYSTKGDTVADTVQVYDIATTATDVKFGAVEGGKLVNNGETKYTVDSWNAYIDALGEVITSIKANDPISKTYAATTHLVMAENELEPVDDEPAGDDITVSGKILIANDANGTASVFGLRGVTVYAVDGEGNVIAETVTNADGEDSTWGDYTLTVPAGTTQLYVGAPEEGADTIVNRGFTIAGDADVTGADVAVVMCDYNDDNSIDVIDKAVFNNAQRGNYNIYADFNNDGSVDVIDKSNFNFISRADDGVVYPELAF